MASWWAVKTEREGKIPYTKKINKQLAYFENVNLGYYCDIYLAKDVLLLVVEFETFRNTYLEHYKLYPAHFYTTPGLAWQTLLQTASNYYEHEAKHKHCELWID